MRSYGGFDNGRPGVITEFIRLTSLGANETMGLGSNFNVYETCLRILRLQGFALRVEGEMDGNDMIPVEKLWFATKGEILLYAGNPIELLGLAAIYNHKNPSEDIPYWWVVDGDQISDELYENAWVPFDD